MNTGTVLDARYGRTRGRRIRARWIAIAVGAGVVVTVVAWVIWAGLLSPTASIETQDVGYHHIDARTLGITSQVSTDPGTRVSCSVEALDEKFAIVGWKVVALAPSAQRTRTIEETVRTSEPAVSGLIGSCWLT